MKRYFLKRCGVLVLLLFATSSLVFLLLHVVPGDPIDFLLGEQARGVERATIRAQLHLDLPLITQYQKFWAGLLRGDLGRSLINQRPVAQLIGNAYPATLQLALTAWGLSLLLAFPLAFPLAST